MALCRLSWMFIVHSVTGEWRHQAGWRVRCNLLHDGSIQLSVGVLVYRWRHANTQWRQQRWRQTSQLPQPINRCCCYSCRQQVRLGAKASSINGRWSVYLYFNITAHSHTFDNLIVGGHRLLLLLLLLTRRLAWRLVQKLQGHVTHTKKTCSVDRERNKRVSSAISTRSQTSTSSMSPVM